MWVAKPYSFDDYGLAGPIGEVDYGSRAGTTVSVVAPAHPLAAGRSGTVTIQRRRSRVTWARAAASATVVARSGTGRDDLHDRGRPAARRRPAGGRLPDELPDLRATRRRRSPPDGWAMFDAAAAWAAAGCASGPVDAPPTVTITAPAGGATVSGTIGVSATATDDVGVTSVGFAVDGTAIGLDQNGADGWSASWNTAAAADGSHVVSATATDTAGQDRNHERLGDGREQPRLRRGPVRGRRTRHADARRDRRPVAPGRRRLPGRRGRRRHGHGCRRGRQGVRRWSPAGSTRPTVGHQALARSRSRSGSRSPTSSTTTA